MHNADCVNVYPHTLHTEGHPRSEPTPTKRKPTLTNPPHGWRQHTLSLRVEVESLEQWLDLNA